MKKIIDLIGFFIEKYICDGDKTEKFLQSVIKISE